MHDYRDDDDKKVINNIFQFAKLRRIRNGTAPVEPKKNVVFYNCVLKICQLRCNYFFRQKSKPPEKFLRRVVNCITELTQVLRKDFFKTDHFSVGYFCLIKNNGALKKIWRGKYD